MERCDRQREVERWFDGEMGAPSGPGGVDSGSVEAHAAACPACGAYVEELRGTREAVQAVSERIEISDGQLPAFLESVRESIEAPERGPKRRRTGLWALGSVAAAALIVALSVVYIVSPRSQPVAAETVVESYSTEIDGATATSFYDEEGTATVWVNVPDGDMW